jgi:hypothetical protein
MFLQNASKLSKDWQVKRLDESSQSSLNTYLTQYIAFLAIQSYLSQEYVSEHYAAVNVSWSADAIKLTSESQGVKKCEK